MSDTDIESNQPSYLTSFIDEFKQANVLNNIIQPQINCITKRVAPYYVLVIVLLLIIIALLIQILRKISN